MDRSSSSGVSLNMAASLHQSATGVSINSPSTASNDVDGSRTWSAPSTSRQYTTPPLDLPEADSGRRLGSSDAEAVGQEEPAAAAQLDTRVQRLLDRDFSHAIAADRDDPSNGNSPLTSTPHAVSTGQQSLSLDSTHSEPRQSSKLALKSHTIHSSASSLAELAVLQRHASVLRIRNRSYQSHLHRRLVAVALGSRLCEHSGASYRRLAYFALREDKRAFASLFNGMVAIRDAYLSVTALNKQSRKKDSPGGTKTWFSSLQSGDRAEVVTLLNAVRSDPTFLVTCISSLSNSELISLVTNRADYGMHHHAPATNTNSATSQALSNALNIGRPKGASQGDFLLGDKGAAAAVDRLVGLGRMEPSFILMNYVFGQGELENRVKLNTWAEVCARLLVAGREGWYNVAWACFDSWVGCELEHNMSNNSLGVGKLEKLGQVFGPSYVHSSRWGARKSVEVFLMGVVERGRSVTSEDNKTKNPDATDKFFENAISDLFDIIGKDGGVPTGVLEFGSALLKSLSTLSNSEHKRGEALYKISDWVLRIFLPNVIASPERSGMLLGMAIRKEDRVQVLRELVARLQRRIVVGKVVPEIRKRIQSMVRRYGNSKDYVSSLSMAKPIGSKPYVSLCPADVLTIINCLFPDRKRVPSVSRSTASLPNPGPQAPKHSEKQKGTSIATSAHPTVSQATPNPTLHTDSTQASESHFSAGSVGVGSSQQFLNAGHLTAPIDLTNSSKPPPDALSRSSTGGSNIGFGPSLGGGIGSAGLRTRHVSALVSVARDEAAGVFSGPFETSDNPGGSAEQDRNKEGVSLHPKGGQYPNQSKNPFFKFSAKSFDGQVVATSAQEMSSDSTRPSEETQNSTSSFENYSTKMRKLAGKVQDLISTLADDKRTFPGPSEKRTATGLCHPCAEMWAIIKIEEGVVVNNGEMGENVLSGFTNDDLDSEETKDSQETRTEPSDGENYDNDPEATRISKAEDHISHQPDSLFAHGDQSRLSLSTLNDFDYQFVRGIILELTRSGFLFTSPSLDSRKSVMVFLEQAYRSSIQREEWLAGHRIQQAMAHLRRVSNTSLGQNDFSPLMRMIYRGIRESVDELEKESQQIDSWTEWVEMAEKGLLSRLDELMLIAGRLRGKLWYTSDVQTSAVYEETRSIASALESMGDCDPDNDESDEVEHNPPSKKKSQNPLFDDDWAARIAKSKGVPSEHGFLFQPDSQTLEILAASKEAGGPRKLNDLQSEITFTWLKSNKVERFCRAEERIFRLSLEISRAVGSLVGKGMMDGPVLWSSQLYEGERKRWWDGAGSVHTTAGQSAYFAGGSSGGGSTPVLANSAGAFQASTPSVSSSFFGFRVRKAEVDFVTETHESPPIPSLSLPAEWSAFSVSPEPRAVGADEDEKKALLHSLRRQLTSLLISDVAASIFWDGSELDRWLRSGRVDKIRKMTCVDSESSNSNLLPTRPIDSLTPVSAVDLPPEFPFDSAFKRILARFAHDPDPAEKLASLHLLEQVVLAYLITPSPTKGQPAEVKSSSLGRPPQGVSSGSMPGTDLIVDMLQSIFRDPDIAPRTLFRDLQYVALFVPSHYIDMGERGKAYWDVSLAALGMKQDVLRAVCNWSYKVVTKWAQETSPSEGTEHEHRQSRVIKTDLSRAVSLITRAAQEGHAAAMRELATLYLRMPGSVRAVVNGLGGAGTILNSPEQRRKSEKSYRSTRSGGKDSPQISHLYVSLARYWMEHSRRAGDPLAKEYLLGKEDCFVDK